jgi:hypothetical protein
MNVTVSRNSIAIRAASDGVRNCFGLFKLSHLIEHELNLALQSNQAVTQSSFSRAVYNPCLKAIRNQIRLNIKPHYSERTLFRSLHDDRFSSPNLRDLYVPFFKAVYPLRSSCILSCITCL